MNLSHQVGGLVIFAVLVSLLAVGFGGFVDGYGIVEVYPEGPSQNVGQRLNNLSIITTVDQLSVQLNTITSPNSNLLDVVGGFLSAGVKIVKLVIDTIIVTPVQIFGIIFDIYKIPGIIVAGIISLISVYLGFVLLRAFFGGSPQ